MEAKIVTVKVLTQRLLKIKNIKKREFQKARREVTFAGKFYKNPVMQANIA